MGCHFWMVTRRLWLFFLPSVSDSLALREASSRVASCPEERSWGKPPSVAGEEQKSSVQQSARHWVPPLPPKRAWKWLLPQTNLGCESSPGGSLSQLCAPGHPAEFRMHSWSWPWPTQTVRCVCWKTRGFGEISGAVIESGYSLLTCFHSCICSYLLQSIFSKKPNSYFKSENSIVVFLFKPLNCLLELLQLSVKSSSWPSKPLTQPPPAFWVSSYIILYLTPLIQPWPSSRLRWWFVFNAPCSSPPHTHYCLCLNVRPLTFQLLVTVLQLDPPQTSPLWALLIPFQPKSSPPATHPITLT